MKQVSFFATLGLLLSGLFVQAQDSTPPATRSRQTGFGLQVFFPNFDRVNNRLGDLRFPELETPLPGLEITMAQRPFKNKRWVDENGFSFTRSLPAESNPNSSTNGLSFTEFALSSRFLYDVLHRRERTKVYPFAGMGLRYQRLRLYEGLPANGSIVTAVNNDLSRLDLTEFFANVELGLSVEQGFKTGQTLTFVALRAAYLVGLRSEWAIDGTFSTDLPTPVAGVPYVALSVRVQRD